MGTWSRAYAHAEQKLSIEPRYVRYLQVMIPGFRMRIRSVGLLLAVASTLGLMSADAARAQSVTVEDVRLGQPGDRWLDTQQFQRLERVTLDGQFGYAVTYDIRGHGRVKIFWPRESINFTDKSPRARWLVLQLKRGRLWYPQIITGRSLPSVHRGILKLDEMYAADARSERAVFEGFSLIVALASARPPVRALPARPVSSGRASVGSSKPTASVTGNSSASSGSRVARTAASTTSTTATKSVTASRRALGRALEKAGHTRHPGAAAHHIVAGNAKLAAPARKTLEKVGIGINEATNGVFLPATRTSANPGGAAVHSTLHTHEYYARVTDMLRSARTRAQAEHTLSEIRQILLSGGF